MPVGSYKGEDIYGCPWLQIEPWCVFYIQLYRHYKNGILWNAGGVADQPILYLRMMEIIENEVNDYEKSLMPDKGPDSDKGSKDWNRKDPRSYGP